MASDTSSTGDTYHAVTDGSMKSVYLGVPVNIDADTSKRNSSSFS